MSMHDSILNGILITKGVFVHVNYKYATFYSVRVCTKYMLINDTTKLM